MRGSPIIAAAGFGIKRHAEIDHFFHAVFYDCGSLFNLIVRRFKDQFVMNLKQHFGLQSRGFKQAADLVHRQFESAR